MLRTMWRKEARFRCFSREKPGIRVVETRNPFFSKTLCQNRASERFADSRKSRVFVPGAQHRLTLQGGDVHPIRLQIFTRKLWNIAIDLANGIAASRSWAGKGMFGGVAEGWSRKGGHSEY
jgi:hypothetical protein